MAVTSTGSGSGTSVKVMPSAASITIPADPISQQIDPVGAVPPVMAWPESVRLATHDAPPFSLRSIAPLTMRHRRDVSADTISIGVTASVALSCSVGSARSAASGADAAAAPTAAVRPCLR